MRLKKIILLTVCILGMYSLIGCQKETEERQYPDGIKQELEQKVPNSVKNNQNTSNETEQEGNEVVEQEENEALQYVTVPREEIVSDEIYSYRLQFGGEIIQLPISVQDMLDMGAVISDDHTESALVEARRNEWVEFKLNGIECKFVCKNESDERATLNKCMINSADAYNEGVFFSKGLSVGMTLEELTSKWGEASEEATMYGLLCFAYPFEKYENEDGFKVPKAVSSYIVEIKPETGKICRIYVQNE